MLAMGQGAAGIAQAMAASGAGAESASQSKLVKAAHEFEGQMMKELLKPMTASDGLTGTDANDSGDGESISGSSGALGEYATEALGQALSLRGGFGIADKIIKELSHSGNQSGNHPEVGKVTKNRNLNTGMRTHKSLE